MESVICYHLDRHPKGFVIQTKVIEWLGYPKKTAITKKTAIKRLRDFRSNKIVILNLNNARYYILKKQRALDNFAKYVNELYDEGRINKTKLRQILNELQSQITEKDKAIVLHRAEQRLDLLCNEIHSHLKKELNP